MSISNASTMSSRSIHLKHLLQIIIAKNFHFYTELLINEHSHRFRLSLYGSL